MTPGGTGPVPYRRRSPLPCEVLGEGPPLMLVHGVAFGPHTFAVVARQLVRAGWRVVIPHRPGYSSARTIPVPASLDHQVEALASTLRSITDEPAAVCGVSGGATLGIALAMSHPTRISSLFVHEPAIGPLAPMLSLTLRQSADAFASAVDPVEPASGLASTLAGDHVWDRHKGDVDLRSLAPVMRREVPLFADFAPTLTELQQLRMMDVTSSRGHASGEARREVADMLIAQCHAREVCLDCGHLAQIEAPHALADAINRTAGAK